MTVRSDRQLTLSPLGEASIARHYGADLFGNQFQQLTPLRFGESAPLGSQRGRDGIGTPDCLT